MSLSLDHEHFDYGSGYVFIAKSMDTLLTFKQAHRENSIIYLFRSFGRRKCVFCEGVWRANHSYFSMQSISDSEKWL